jgi:hypothetical protein
LTSRTIAAGELTIRQALEVGREILHRLRYRYARWSQPSLAGTIDDQNSQPVVSITYAQIPSNTHENQGRRVLIIYGRKKRRTNETERTNTTQ